MSALRIWLLLAVLSSSLACSLASAQEIPRLPPPGLDAPPANLPRVRLISLGGTISGTATERLNITNYGAPRLAPQDWINALQRGRHRHHPRHQCDGRCCLLHGSG